MKISRCLGCMSEVEDETKKCPRCGFDLSSHRQGEQALPIGGILHGRYLVGKVLGQGGFGITYVGYDLLLDVPVAIKEFYPAGQAVRSPGSTTMVWAPTENPQSSKDNFLREARKMAKIEKVPAVVNVRDIFFENETAYIGMEYVSGETLKRKLTRNGTMAPKDCYRLLRPVIEGMGKIHNLGMIHRDISPDNIMIDLDGNAVLLDLGAAKEIQSGDNNSQLVVKKGFSPPEQYTNDGEIGPWTDVYAMTATMVYAITGKVVPEAMSRLMKDTVDLSMLPGNLAAVMKKGLTLMSKDRYQSMGELMEALDQIFPNEDDLSFWKKIKKGLAANWKKLACAAAAVLCLCGGIQVYRNAQQNYTIKTAEALLNEGKDGVLDLTAVDGLIRPLEKSGNAKVSYILGLLAVEQDDLEGAEELLRQAENAGQADAKIARWMVSMSGEKKDLPDDLAGQLKTLLEQGHPQASLALAIAYRDGISVLADATKASDYWKQSAELGSLYWKARAIYEETLRQNTSVQMFENHKSAAALGYMRAANMVGRYYGEGWADIAVDPEQAVQYYRIAAEGGYRTGMYNLACCFRDGTGTDKDDAAALEWYRKAAELGHATAMNQIGLYYDPDSDWGIAEEKDPEKAVEWYRRAAENGNAYGCYNLGYAYEYGIGVEKDLSEALKNYQKAAELNNISGMNALGRFYEKGISVAQNYPLAMEWYTKAANNGSKNAMYRLGKLYAAGTASGKNLEEAFKWFKKAADQGYTDAYYKVAQCYDFGDGVTQDHELARQWYEKGAEAGNADAMYQLGYNFVYGAKNYEKDVEKGIMWLTKGAEGGNDQAMFCLGFLYTDGKEGVEADIDKAVEWYEKAVAQGNASAMTNLGWIYRNGKTGEKDYDKAFELLSKAAELGEKNAMHNLGYMYYNGEGRDKDYDKAFELFLKAAEKDSEAGMTSVADMYRKGQGVKKDEQKAFEWYLKAAEKGNLYGIEWVGCMYRDGTGVKKDLEKAMEWFTKGMEKNSGYSCYILGLMYENGEGVPANRNKAKELFKKAADLGNTDAAEKLQKKA